MRKVLIFNPGYTNRCGVHAHGKRMFEILREGGYNTEFHYAEVTNEEAMRGVLKGQDWDVVIYNYYPGSMDWVHEMQPRAFGGAHLGLIHEVTQETVESAPDPIFHGWIATDPSLVLEGRNPKWFKTVRPLPNCRQQAEHRGFCESRPKIGSFGFAFPNKGFDRLARAVNLEFDDAVLLLHITKNYYSDNIPLGGPDAIFAQVQAEITKPGIEIRFTSDFVTDDELVNRLAHNDLNCLFYDRNPGRGISSAVDYCVASGAPLLVTESEQFRHIKNPAMHYPQETLTGAIALRLRPVLDLQNEWSRAEFCWNYDCIITAVTS